MKFTYTPIANIYYTEEGQPNKIRWCLATKTEDGYVNMANWMRCRDYFNDVCVKYNGGKDLSVYGFNTATLTLPPVGMPIYIAVCNLENEFHNNLEAFNVWLIANRMPPVASDVLASDVAVLEIPAFFLANTHHISLLTLIIRLLNTAHKFATFEEVINQKSFPAQEQNKWTTIVAYGKFFNIPTEYKKYYWYSGKVDNSETVPTNRYNYSVLIHNNGVLSWIYEMKRDHANSQTCTA
jgi:hypothetical protein